VEIVSFQTSAQDLNDTGLTHLLLNVGVLTYVQQDVKGNKKELILLPDENVEFFQLGFCCYFIFFIIFSPHFDVLTVEQIKALNLVLQDINNSFSDLLFSDIFLKLSIV
jgi:hypothetical protein